MVSMKRRQDEPGQTGSGTEAGSRAAAASPAFLDQVAQNVAQLAAAADVLGRTSAEDVVAKDARLFPHGSVGMHLRHILGYYECLLAATLRSGAAVPSVDYDAREREPLLETDRRALLGRIDMLQAGLHQLAQEPGVAGRRVLVRDNGRGLADDAFPSSVARELAFLLSHTVHHFAVAGMILRLRGLELPEGFGVAPSTLAHWRKEAAGSAS